jgi:hypothetical protein
VDNGVSESSTYWYQVTFNDTDGDDTTNASNPQVIGSFLTPACTTDDITSFSNSAEASSCRTVTVTGTFAGDADGDSTTIVEYREDAAGPPWTTICGNVGGPSPRQCIVADTSTAAITRGGTYYIHVTYLDPDGVPATNDETIGPITLPSCGTDDTPPTAVFLAPRRNAVVSGTDLVMVQVYDGGGLASSSPVQLAVNDGSFSAATENTNYDCGNGCSVWEYTLNTSGLADDSHRITVQVSDNKSPANVARVSQAFRSYNPSGQPGGSGQLLRRTTGSQICSDCHNIPTHSSQWTSSRYGNWAIDCMTCHTPHKTTNIFLIRQDIQTPNTGLHTVKFHYDDGLTAGNDNPGDATADNPDLLSFLGDWSGASGEPYTDGICETCHTRTKYHRNDTSGDNNHSHNASTRCLDCHSHAQGFVGSGSCLGCHSNDGDAGTQGANSRRPVLPDFSKESHHVGNGGSMGGSLTDFDCVVCHAEGRAHDDDSDGTWEVTTTSEHQDEQIDLRDADNDGTSFTYDKDAIDGDGSIAGPEDWNSGNATWVTQTSTALDPFCLSCHDGGSNAGAQDSYSREPDGVGGFLGTPTNPFGDGTVTNNYDQVDRGGVVDIASRVVAGGSDLDTDGTGPGTRQSQGINDPPEGIYSRHAIRGQSLSVYEDSPDAGIPTAYWNRTQFAWNDSSVMGCADCHTTDGANTTEGNAHGSYSEYLLKDGDGLANEGRRVPSTDPLDNEGPYNCYLCHQKTRYDAEEATFDHTGNTQDYTDYVNLAGTSRIVVGNDGGNIYAYACGNCHGGVVDYDADGTGDFEFGTIHGTSQIFDIRNKSGEDVGDREAYRFTNGNSLRFYDPQDWATAPRTCYTIDKGENDSFGGCTKHGGGQSEDTAFARDLSY